MSSKTINEIVTGFRQKFIKDIEQVEGGAAVVVMSYEGMLESLLEENFNPEQVEALFVLQEAVITALLNKQNEQQ
ncbi:MAG: hypothetical protein M0R77_07570 [Gammaproteobacteria bacterium]|nr:hypothetical protein [Gammaproteobacteria bacterium]